jgi:hypothetical protein
MGTLRTASMSILVAALLVAVLAAAAPPVVSAAAGGSSKPEKTPATAAMPSPAPASVSPAPDVAKRRDRANEQRDLEHAKVVLAKLQKTYRYLGGVTLRMDPTPDDRQAVAYYTEGEIVISPDHVATIDKILAHEVWHIIDYRDNGRLDWGEDLPPSNASAYRSKY